MMKQKVLLTFFALALTAAATAGSKTVTSPDGKLAVTISDDKGIAQYGVTYDGRQMLLPSRLGLDAQIGDFTRGVTIAKDSDYTFHRSFDISRTKTSHVDFSANATDVTLQKADGKTLVVTFVVGNNDIAYRYTVPREQGDNSWGTIIRSETSSFRFPDCTTTFLCPQITPMTGWERTKPSYEEEYTPDAPMTRKSQYGVGYTFPCLFRVGQDGWVLVSETGVDAHYPGSRLSDWDARDGYTVAFPQEGENNGFGSATAAVSIPAHTPWRTITVGKTLAPVVETTIPFAVTEERYRPSQVYKPGRYTWSWLIWQDGSINYADQVQFIDLAARYGYEYVLVDGCWDQDAFIGRQKTAQLSQYAQSKGVRLLLWYNSNGFVNNAYQTPKNVMNDAIARKRDMAWMRSIGVAGIKVDFFGGDKQETMQLYQDILSDANDYGLQVIFHGCTLPRGWERMFPNYAGSEAALASENVFFTDYHARKEGFEMTMYPFTRNAVGSFDWGGVILNSHMSKDNQSRHPRYTSDVFELATAITNQASVNCVAVTPNITDGLNGVTEAFLRDIPTAWTQTRFIDGYPGRSFFVARQAEKNGKWYVGGINGSETEPLKTTLSLPMLAGKPVTVITDNRKRQAQARTTTVGKDGMLKVSLPHMGGIIVVEQ